MTQPTPGGSQDEHRSRIVDQRLVDVGAGQSLDEEAAELWTKCYQAEIYGETYFEQLLARTKNVEVREKVKALAAVERSTKEILAGPMERLGLSTEPDPSVVAEARANTADYEGTLRAVPAGAAEFLRHYARLRQLADQRDLHTVDCLIAHELAVELFARRELAGDSGNSLQPIEVLAHVRF